MMNVLQELMDLSGRTLLLIFGVSALFGATASYALAVYGRLPRPLAITIGVLFSFLGVLVLGIVVLARRSNRTPAVAAAQPATREALDAGSGYAGFDDWDSPASALASSPAGFGGGSGFGFDDGEVAAPVATPVAARAPRRGFRDRLSTAWVRSRAGQVTAGLGVVAVLVVVASIFVGWLSINAAITPRFWVYPLGTGVDVALLVTAVIGATAVASLATRPLLSVGVLLAWVADTWLLGALLLIVGRESVARFLAEIGALTLSVGDLLESVGIDTTAGVVDLPPGVDLSSLGITGRTVDMSSMELGAVIPDVSVEIGPGVYLIIAFAVLINAAVFVVIRSADRARFTHSSEGEQL